jgi:hypothetical protein
VAPAATLVPAAFDFGDQAAGSRSAGRDFAVRNEGAAPLDLGATALVGADLDQFALAGDDCSGETLAPGEECLIRVRFAPDSNGAKTARLRVGGDSGPFVATLAGTGTGTGADAAAGEQPNGAFAHPGPPPRPWRQGRPHRRFVRGEAIGVGRAERSRRAHKRETIRAR